MKTADRLLGTMLLATALTVGPGVGACGLEDPTSAERYRGLLNWSYPNALYVTSAVWQAENAGLLPSRATEKKNEFAAYLQTVKALKALARLMGQAGEALTEAPAVSIVLIDKMLWTRFEYGPQGYAAKVHADGPAKGDVVIVTEGSVIQALVDAGLSAERAGESGLTRFYGDNDKIARVQDLLRQSNAAGTSPLMQAADEGH